MHLIKSEGDSTLQAFATSYSFKPVVSTQLADQTMVSTLDWMRHPSGDKAVLSGTNLPVTVLNLNTKQENGI